MLRPTFNAGLLSFLHNFILAFKERHFAKRVVKHLLKSYAAVSVEKLDLSGKALYREVLLHTQQIDPSRVDQILRQAEESVDEWTAPGRSGLGFREVVHFFVMLKHIEAGHKGAVVSFGEIVDTLIPAHLQGSFAGDRSSRYLPTVGALRGSGYIGRLKLDQAEIEAGGDQEASDVGSISRALTIKLAESGS